MSGPAVAAVSPRRISRPTPQRQVVLEIQHEDLCVDSFRRPGLCLRRVCPGWCVPPRRQPQHVCWCSADTPRFPLRRVQAGQR